MPKGGASVLTIGSVFDLLEIEKDLGVRVTKSAGKRPTYMRLFLCLCHGCGQKAEVKASRLYSRRRPLSCGCVFRAKRALGAKRLPEGEGAFRNLVSGYKGNAKQRSIEFRLTNDELRFLFAQCCHYCGCEPSAVWKSGYDCGDFMYNGVDRVNNDLGYTPENVVTCCKMCNLAKKDLSTEEFLAWVGRVYEHSLAVSRPEAVGF